jgi:hypothetical protein
MQLTGPQIGVTAGSVLPGARREPAAGAHHAAIPTPGAAHAAPATEPAPELLTYGPTVPRGAAAGVFRGAHVDVRV